MLPLSEIAGLAATLEARRSGVADVVAAAWEVPAGSALFWRSSACHVFVVDHPAGKGYMRFVPDWWRPRAAVAVVAELMRSYGPGVAQPVPSTRGRLVETVRTPRGQVHAMLVAEAPGRLLELAELDQPYAQAWGAALARLHRDGPAAVGARLPAPFTDLDRAGQLRPGDRPLVDAVARVRAALDRLPRDGDCFGVTHGDFELDNLAWAGQRVTPYDFDDAGRSWYVADIAHALRDLLPTPAAGAISVAVLAGDPLTAAFLAGYRTIRDLPEPDLARVPLFTAAHAATWLIRLPTILASQPAPTDPPWLDTLRTKLHSRADQQRALVLANAPAG